MSEPLAFLDWLPASTPPLWSAAAIFVMTFVLEDVATVGAGLLLSAGAVNWPVAFWPCFTGVWLGDVGLYAVARLAGRSWFERSRFFAQARSRVADSERWFEQHGGGVLVLSRFLPGARLPTYLAAGFLRMPAAKFLFITGAASLVWTLGILLVARSAGARVLGWVGNARGIGSWLLALVLVWLALRFAMRSPAARRWLERLRLRFLRWRHWEFWPAWVFYPPVALHCLRLGIKYRGLTLPTAANPGIFAGGLVGESKLATLREIEATSPEFTAAAELVAGHTPAERLVCLREISARRQLGYPLVLKPDIGQRGAGFKLIHHEAQAEEYFHRTDAPLIAQRYVPGPHEVGIFYCRHPNETHGSIFAITEKVFPQLVGDGQSTVEQLIFRDPRARFIAATYLQRWRNRRAEVLPAGAEMQLVEAGNHAQGCIFRDGWHLWTAELTARIDEISRRIEGFFIGRYDIRCASLDDLRAGRNFRIIELNGAASEATNIYDARNSLRAAYRTLFRQWELVFAIGAANRQRGVKPMPLPVVWRAWREYGALLAGYPAAD